jgi:hypothetical protein
VSGNMGKERAPSKVSRLGSAALPVVPCSTIFALAAPPPTVPLPSSISVNIPGDLAAQLAVYSDSSGIMMMMAPKGWSCTGTYGADGSGGLIIHPDSEIVPSTSWGEGWHLSDTSQDEAITGTQPGGSATQALGYACSIFHKAAVGFEKAFGHPCPAHLASEQVRQVTSHAFGFEDPPGVQGLGIPSGGEDPAIGVNIYTTSTTPGAYIATCTMPKSERLICSAVSKYFAERYGNK